MLVDRRQLITSEPTSTGFNGDDLIQVPALPAAPGRRGPPPPLAQQDAARAARVVAAKQEGELKAEDFPELHDLSQRARIDPEEAA